MEKGKKADKAIASVLFFAVILAQGLAIWQASVQLSKVFEIQALDFADSLVVSLCISLAKVIVRNKSAGEMSKKDREEEAEFSARWEVGETPLAEYAGKRIGVYLVVAILIVLCGMLVQ